MAIRWNAVTRTSQIVAVVLFVAVFALGYWLGTQKAAFRASEPTQLGTPIISDVTYACDGSKTIRARYRENSVQLLLSDGRNLLVPQAISASGARYANDDESFVFWSKGTGAFVTEGEETTYADCEQMSAAGE